MLSQNAHMRTFLATTICLLCLASFQVQAQLDKKEFKAYKKSVKLFEKEKYSDAIEKLEPVVLAHNEESKLWNVLVHYYETRYYKAPTLNFSVKVEGGDSEEAALLQDLMSKALNAPETEYYDVMKRATASCPDLFMTSVKLRKEYIDPLYPVDTDISSDAKSTYLKAEEAFIKQDFETAVELYQSALEKDHNFYGAHLYWGDSYYAQKKYSMASPIFKELADKNPDLLEPQKYLVDALAGQEKWVETYDACIKAIMVYPDASMFAKLGDVSEAIGKEFDRHWMARVFLPNVMGQDQDEIDHPDWKYYREAKALIAPFCDDHGIVIKDNNLTESDYMETFCWEYMLEKAAKGDEFATARSMKEKGLLDFYVLICLSHVDVYHQVKHLNTTRKQEVVKFFNTKLVK